MKPEPLKGKGVTASEIIDLIIEKITEPLNKANISYNLDFKEISKLKEQSKMRLYDDGEIKSAVEWFKDKIEFEIQFINDDLVKPDIYEIINKAFEDVIK